MRGYIFAAAIGYLVGTLWAPRRGAELRANIVEHFESGKSEIINGGQQIIESVKERGTELIEGAENKYTQASATAVKAKKIAKDSMAQLGESMGEIADEGAKLFSPDGGH